MNRTYYNKIILKTFIPVFLAAALSLFSACFNEEIYPVGKRTIPEDYHPFVMEGKQWNYQAVDLRTSMSCTCSYRIHGDTLIGKTMYKKLLMQVSSQEDREQWMYVGALREMAMQVFYLRKDNHNEDLIYDFGVRKGNKLKWNGLKVEVSSIDQYLVSKAFRHRIIDLNGIDYCMCAYQWIEGIGSDNDFLFWKEDFIVIQYLASCYENDVCIYDWEYLGFDRCNIKAEPFDPNTFDSSEEEAAFHEWVEQHPDSAGYINLWFEGSTLCVKGIMKLGPYPTFAECYTENYYEKKPEDVNEVRFSIYQHKSDSENELMPMWVNLKIGNFQSGIYHFVPNNKGYFAPLLKECTLICE